MAQMATMLRLRHRRGGGGVAGHFGEGVDGVGHRQQVADRFQRWGHLVAGPDQAAQQQLGDDHRRHQLGCLEFAAGEGAGEQAEGHPEQGVGDGDGDDQPRRARGVEAEQPVGDAAGDHRLGGGGEGEGEPVADEQVELVDGGGEQSLEGAAGAFSEHRHAGDEEHGDQREHPEQGYGPAVEHGGVGVEHEPQQGQLDGRQGDDEHDGASVMQQLDEDPAGGGQRDRHRHVRRLAVGCG